MIRILTSLVILICLIAMAPGQGAAQSAAAVPIAEINQRITDGRLTRIVCFGDSITGAYYHTGGQRAWCDMLGLALQKANPNANLQMINAGISGHTTVNALARIEKDVIAKKPHLVVIMFGMNDVTRVPLETYKENMSEIIERCQNAGAAVVLCTPNGVSTNKDRPEQKLAQYAAGVQLIAEEFALPVVDCFKDWQTLRSEDPVGWSLLMSDAIHPNMNGHIRFAELMAESICGRPISLHEASPPLDVLHHTFDRLNRNEVVKVVAMPPYNQLVPDELKQHFPGAAFEVTVWPTENQSVAEMADWAKRIRGMKPHLVIPAVPLPSLNTQQEDFISEFEWVLNWSFQFAGRPWDVIPVMPLETDDTTESQHRNLANARRTVLGKDVRFIERGADDHRTVVDIVSSWITDQKRAWQKARSHSSSEERQCSDSCSIMADKDRATLQDAAKKLRAWLDPKYSRVVDSSNPDVVTRRRTFGTTDYASRFSSTGAGRIGVRRQIAATVFCWQPGVNATQIQKPPPQEPSGTTLCECSFLPVAF